MIPTDNLSAGIFYSRLHLKRSYPTYFSVAIVQIRLL